MFLVIVVFYYNLLFNIIEKCVYSKLKGLMFFVNYFLLIILSAINNFLILINSCASIIETTL